MLYIILMLATGCLISLQSPINAALGRHIGMLEASLVNFFTGLVFLAVLLLFFGKGDIFSAIHAPAWQWLGGILGAAMVYAAIISIPHIGVLAAGVAMILGNLAMAAIIDNFGWFGLPVTPFSIKRLFGFCLVLGGLFLIFKK